MQEHDNILEMRKIDKLFPGVKALDSVDFSVKRGEVHCLIGANGAGKSTLMKILSGAYVEDSGEIIFDGENSNRMERWNVRKKVFPLFIRNFHW